MAAPRHAHARVEPFGERLRFGDAGAERPRRFAERIGEAEPLVRQRRREAPPPRADAAVGVAVDERARRRQPRVQRLGAGEPDAGRALPLQVAVRAEPPMAPGDGRVDGALIEVVVAPDADAIVGLVEQRAGGVVVAEVAGRAVVRRRQIDAQAMIAAAPACRRRARAERSRADRDAQLGHERAATRDQVDGAADRLGAELDGRHAAPHLDAIEPGDRQRRQIDDAGGRARQRHAVDENGDLVRFRAANRDRRERAEPAVRFDEDAGGAVDQIGHRHHARRRLRGIDRRHHRLGHRPAHRRAIRRRLRLGLLGARASRGERGDAGKRAAEE